RRPEIDPRWRRWLGAGRHRRPATAWRSGPGQLAEHVFEDAAVLEIGKLHLGVDANLGFEPNLTSSLGPGRDAYAPAGPQAFGDTDHVVALLTGETERIFALPVQELQRQDTHADQVRAVDTLERLREDGAHAEQERPLCCPVTARAGAVVLPTNDQKRRSLVTVAHGDVVDCSYVT